MLKALAIVGFISIVVFGALIYIIKFLEHEDV